MKKALFTAIAVMFAVACTQDFGIFESASNTDGGTPFPIGEDAGGGSDANADAPAERDAGDLPDGDNGPNDAGELADAQEDGGGGATCDEPTCIVDLSKCGSDCNSASTTCRAPCNSGSNGRDCRRDCDSKLNACAEACESTCVTCERARSCPAFRCY